VKKHILDTASLSKYREATRSQFGQLRRTQKRDRITSHHLSAAYKNDLLIS